MPKTWVCALMLGSIAAAACNEAPRIESTSTVAKPIINGTPADEGTYGAVAALVYTVPDTDIVLDTFCSATLVAPKSVVTARHCTPAITEAPANGLGVAVAFGPDALTSTTIIPITDFVTAPGARPPESGLLRDGGRDVAVVHLASIPVDIRPAQLGKFQESMGDTKFQIAGFGINNFEGFYGTKYSGTATARATNGKWYPLLFKNDRRAFMNWYFNDSALAEPSEEEARRWWETFRLENKFELLAGGLPGEAVGCYGDSGGPLLLGSSAHDLTVYGVSFAVEGTFSTVCGLGGAYSVFNPTLYDFVNANLK